MNISVLRLADFRYWPFASARAERPSKTGRDDILDTRDIPFIVKEKQSEIEKTRSFSVKRNTTRPIKSISQRKRVERRRYEPSVGRLELKAVEGGKRTPPPRTRALSFSHSLLFSNYLGR